MLVWQACCRPRHLLWGLGGPWVHAGSRLSHWAASPLASVPCLREGWNRGGVQGTDTLLLRVATYEKYYSPSSKVEKKIQRVLVGIYLTPACFSSSQFALSLDFFTREPRSSWLVLKTRCSQRCCWHEHCLLRAQPLPQTLRGLSVRPWPALGREGPPACPAAPAAVARPCSSCLAGVKVRLQRSVVLPLCQACREKVGAPCLLSCAGRETGGGRAKEMGW